jgi:hypothetical protein
MNCRICNTICTATECGFPSDQCRNCYLASLSDSPCSGTKRRLCDDFSCRKCYSASLAARDNHVRWSYQKNVRWPVDIFGTTNKKYWFTCVCGHDSYVPPVKAIMSSCAYCCTPSRKLCDCTLCHSRSFAAHTRSINWSSRNKLTPSEVALQSNKKFWFECSECLHEFDVSPATIVTCNTWCPYCAGHKLCNNDCKMCYDRSFAATDKARYWSAENAVSPRHVFRRTAKKYAFTCAEGHDFKAAPDSVAAGKWCPSCRNKTEALIADALTARGVVFSQQPRFDWCRNVLELPFDFLVGRTLVECDGDQHFHDSTLFKSTAVETRSRDVQKMQAALAQGYRVVRISQVGVWTGSFDWRAELAAALTCEERCMYLASDTRLYDAHRDDLSKHDIST